MPQPSGVMSPSPVTTTRRLIPSIGLSFPACLHVLGRGTNHELHPRRTATATTVCLAHVAVVGSASEPLGRAGRAQQPQSHLCLRLRILLSHCTSLTFALI